LRWRRRPLGYKRIPYSIDGKIDEAETHLKEAIRIDLNFKLTQAGLSKTLHLKKDESILQISRDRCKKGRQNPSPFKPLLPSRKVMGKYRRAIPALKSTMVLGLASQEKFAVEAIRWLFSIV